jgi:hypothetical protein
MAKVRMRTRKLAALDFDDSFGAGMLVLMTEQTYPKLTKASDSLYGGK